MEKERETGPVSPFYQSDPGVLAGIDAKKQTPLQNLDLGEVVVSVKSVASL